MACSFACCTMASLFWAAGELIAFLVEARKLLRSDTTVSIVAVVLIRIGSDSVAAGIAFELEVFSELS